MILLELFCPKVNCLPPSNTVYPRDPLMSQAEQVQALFDKSIFFNHRTVIFSETGRGSFLFDFEGG